MRRFLLAAVMLGAVSVAQAADLPEFLRGSYAPPAPRLNWEGWYVGGQGSYGSTNSKIPSTINNDLLAALTPPAGLSYASPSLGAAHGLDIGYGGFVGYNSQWEDVVVGIEGNYLHGGFGALTSATANTFNGNSIATTTNSSASLNVTDFGSARLRAGYVVGSFLPYLYGGIGVGSETVDRNVSASPPPVQAFGSVFSATKTKLVYGYSAGAGVDILLIRGLFFRAEYEYQRITSTIESNVNDVRFGLGYKF